MGVGETGVGETGVGKMAPIRGKMAFRQVEVLFQVATLNNLPSKNYFHTASAHLTSRSRVKLSLVPRLLVKEPGYEARLNTFSEWVDRWQPY